MLSLPPTLCELGARHWHTRSTYARHRIRHGIRHTAARAGRRPRPSVPNGRLRHMLIGYARVSKADGSQSLDLQRVALQAAGVDAGHVYHDVASGVRDDRPGLDSCVRAPDGRRARRLEARPPRPHPRPPGQHRADLVGPRREPAGAHRARRPDPGREPRRTAGGTPSVPTRVPLASCVLLETTGPRRTDSVMLAGQWRPAQG